MKFYSRWGHVIRFVLVTLVCASPLAAQYQEDYHPPARAQFTGFGGFQWGGGYNTNSLNAIPAGSLNLAESFAWGGVLSFIPQRYSAVELWYLRQDTDIGFNPVAGGSRQLGGFANNYIQVGGRQEFPTGNSGLRPFLGGTLGINILDPKATGIGSTTEFAFSFGGGLQYMLGAAQRFGVRTDVRWWVTTVPSGDYGVWCDFYACYAAQGTAWVSQGQVSGGLTVAF